MTEGCDCPEVHSLIKSVFMAGSTADRMDAALAAQQTSRSAEDLHEVSTPRSFQL